MILDELGIKIILELFKKGITNTWEMASKFSNDENPCPPVRYGKNKLINDTFGKIQWRLKKFENEGIIKIEKNGEGKNVYLLLTKRVKHCKHKFPCGYRDSIMILDSEDKWIILQL